jgi:hypothetical protein
VLTDLGTNESPSTHNSRSPSKTVDISRYISQTAKPRPIRSTAARRSNEWAGKLLLGGCSKRKVNALPTRPNNDRKNDRIAKTDHQSTGKNIPTHKHSPLSIVQNTLDVEFPVNSIIVNDEFTNGGKEINRAEYVNMYLCVWHAHSWSNQILRQQQSSQY